MDFYSVCQACTSTCCKGARPPITSTRQGIIEKFLDVNDLGIEEPFTNTSYVFPRETIGGYCVFLGKNRECLIHEVKPETCVAGPVTFDVDFLNRKVIYYLKKESICPLAGYLFRNKELMEKHLAVAIENIENLLINIHVPDLFEVLKVEEPETFKILSKAFPWPKRIL